MQASRHYTFHLSNPHSHRNTHTHRDTPTLAWTHTNTHACTHTHDQVKAEGRKRDEKCLESPNKIYATNLLSSIIIPVEKKTWNSLFVVFCEYFHLEHLEVFKVSSNEWVISCGKTWHTGLLCLSLPVCPLLPLFSFLLRFSGKPHLRRTHTSRHCAWAISDSMQWPGGRVWLLQAGSYLISQTFMPGLIYKVWSCHQLHVKKKKSNLYVFLQTKQCLLSERHLQHLLALLIIWLNLIRFDQTALVCARACGQTTTWACTLTAVGPERPTHFVSPTETQW